MKVAVIGLGKLGSSLAAVFSSKGHEVSGCDLNEVYADKLSKGFAPVEETGLQDLLGTCGPILATTDIRFAVAEAEIIFIIVPTASLDDGSFSAEYVQNVLFAIAAVPFGRGVKYPIIAVVSTLSPGTMVCLRDAFESSTGGTCGKDFGLVYNPEFIALGSVIHDLLNPHFVLIGEEDERSGDILEKFYETIHDAPVKRMSFISAEITKLGLNVALCQRISYANSVSELCENYPGANAFDVLEAIGTDRRIGSSYLSPGSAYGGPCFPRDCRALQSAARKVECQAWMSEAADEVNRRQVVRIEQIVNRVSPDGYIAILGSTYKTNTKITEESAGMDLLERLKSQGRDVCIYDPSVCSPGLLGILASECETLVVMTPWPEFRNIPLSKDSNATIIDGWGIVDQSKLPSTVRYLRLGVSE